MENDVFQTRSTTNVQMAFDKQKFSLEAGRKLIQNGKKDDFQEPR